VRSFQIDATGIRPLLLVVDDDEFQHQILRELLHDENLDMTFETSAAQSLLALAKSHPDLILMDVELPGVDGIEATRRIKAIPQFAHIPILMITGRVDKERVVECVSAGAAGFVVKPFRKEIVLAKILSCLHGGGTAGVA
jgi:CheY-like chemotaxis protein